MFRDLLVFQGKLFLDGLRDIALSPASLVLALVDVLSGDRSGNRFYKLLSLGKRSDHWINLFGAADDADESGASPPADREQDPTSSADRAANVDDVVQRLEGLVREQYRNGSMSETARRAINRGLDGLRAGRRTGGDSLTDNPADDIGRGPGTADGSSATSRLPEQDR
ncbi:MAG: hypothetical protein KJO38_08475 [Gammaproteobacteria bacterium]|nr:hypothetical protein [Gammaproteobacteria bacterium]